MRKPSLSGAVLAAFAALAIPALAAIPAAPVAKQVPVVDDYFGTKITDPYRWMEQPNNPDLQAYLKAQRDRTRSILDSIPARKTILDRVTALFSTVTSSSNVSRRGALLFYLKLTPGAQLDKLYVRNGIGGTERVLLDPATMSSPGQQQVAISYYYPSYDGKLVAVGVASGGSEAASVRILETSTGKLLPDVVDRARFGVTFWRDDGKAFYYARTQVLAPGAPLTARYQHGRTDRHGVGSDAASDRAVFGAGVSDDVVINPNAFAFALVTPSSPYAIGILQNGVQREVTIYVAPKSQMDSGKANWRRVVVPEDGVVDEAVHGGDLYLLTHKDAPRGKVIELRLTDPNVATAPVAIPAGDRVLESVAAALERALRQIDGGRPRPHLAVCWNGMETAARSPCRSTERSAIFQPNPTRPDSWPGSRAGRFRRCGTCTIHRPKR